MDIEKARGDRARIEELIAKQSAVVRRAFMQFLNNVKSEAARRQVRLALERGDIEAALRTVDVYIVRLGSIIPRVFTASAEAEMATLAARAARTMGNRVLTAISFDPSSPRAAELMRRNRLEFIAEFTGAQRQATRAALTEALRSGAGPIQAARAFQDSIGLTEYQRQAVANYRRMLEAGDATVLQRDLRDRRFDPTVQRAITEGEALGAERINRMVEQYRRHYLQYRAETIARTETMRTLGLARQEALAQTLEDVELPRQAVVRVWRATQDARTRDTHAAMDGQERPLNVPFDSPSGVQLMYPGDPTAPPEETIQCRCVVLHEFR